MIPTSSTTICIPATSSSSSIKCNMIESSAANHQKSKNYLIHCNSSSNNNCHNSHNNNQIHPIESISPVTISSIHFEDDVGPIPPPRMFSDSIVSALHTAESMSNGPECETKAIENGVNNKTIGDVNFDQDTFNIQQNQMDFIHNNYSDGLIESFLNYIMNMDSLDDGTCKQNPADDDKDEFDFDEWNSPLVEEVPVKQPQFTAIPKKSALKKPKDFAAANGQTANNNNYNDNNDDNVNASKPIVNTTKTITATTPTETTNKNNHKSSTFTTNIPNG